MWNRRTQQGSTACGTTPPDVMAGFARFALSRRSACRCVAPWAYTPPEPRSCARSGSTESRFHRDTRGGPHVERRPDRDLALGAGLPRPSRATRSTLRGLTQGRGLSAPPPRSRRRLLYEPLHGSPQTLALAIEPRSASTRRASGSVAQRRVVEARRVETARTDQRRRHTSTAGSVSDLPPLHWGSAQRLSARRRFASVSIAAISAGCRPASW
jgi:hypothetical protein